MTGIKRLLRLYYAFFKVGLFTIGGGYAMLPIVERELVKDRELISMEDVMECYTLAQTLPGVIASNAAALIGYRLYKKRGATVSVLGVIMPSILLITLIAMVFQQFENIEAVQSAFKGIRVIVLALLIDSFTRLYKVAVFDRKTLLITGLSFAMVMGGILNPIIVILMGGFLGAIIYRERVGK